MVIVYFLQDLHDELDFYSANPQIDISFGWQYPDFDQDSISSPYSFILENFRVYLTHYFSASARIYC
jgi:hypothetical protein